MNDLQLSQNITRLRREKKVTQEQLACHIGVTKGAVSKWENGSTLPDLATLPLLASYFDVSVDALLGYTPQLSSEEIRAHYLDFAKAFSQRPFEDVFAEIQELAKTYYSCYPLLFQMAALLLNHFTLADAEAQPQVLAYMDELLSRVRAETTDRDLAADARVLQAMVWLQQGRYDETVQALEAAVDPARMAGYANSVLISAYLMQGKVAEADRQAQLGMYKSLIELIGRATHFVMIHATEREAFQQTVARIEAVIAAYDLTALHPNSVAQFYYQAAMVALAQNDKAETLRLLEGFVRAMAALYEPDGFRLHGDAYFTALDSVVAELDLGESAPRDRDMVRRDVLSNFAAPFAALAGDPAFERLQIKLKAVMA